MAKMSNLDDLLAALKEQKSPDDEEENMNFPGVPEALVMELRERSRAYIEALTEVPYKVGDFVTPKHGTNTKGAGKPHIVIEVRPNAQPVFDTRTLHSVGDGVRAQVRTLSYAQDYYVAFWHEAGILEPYTG